MLDNETIQPFSTVVFNSFGGIDRVIEVTLDNDAKGSFDILGGFSEVEVSGSTVYRLIGSAVDATDSIQNLRFIPTPNRITGSSETVQFTISVKTAVDATSSLSDDQLDVTVFPVNDAPTISSESPEFRINDDETTEPFATMGLNDLDEGGEQELTVRISYIGQDPCLLYTSPSPRDA